MKMAHRPAWNYWIWRLSGIIHTFGEKHSDFKKFHFGWIDDSQMRDLVRLKDNFGIIGDIESLENNTIRLQDGRLIATDILTCCTGSGSNRQEIEFFVEDNQIDLNEIYDVYHSSVITQVPNLFFTAYHQFFIGTANGLCHGKWIAKYIEFAPDERYLQKNSENYSYPFFSRHFISDSNVYYILNNYSKMHAFFVSGELDKDRYEDWFAHSFFSNDPVKPIDFNLPTKGE
jgi:hypothetical protein